MPRKLSEVDITHVSYVSRGANNKTFLLTKSAEEENIKKQIDIITKADDEKQLVYGVVYEPDVVDAHGDYMTSDEIEKSAHRFMELARNIDKQHDFNAGVGTVVESYIAPANIEISGQSISKGTWILVTKASDEVWKSIKDGSITGYSMAGVAHAVEEQEVIQEQEMEKSAGFAEKVASYLGEWLSKGVVSDYYKNQKVRSNAFLALNALENAMYDADGIEEMRVAANEFAMILNEISYEDLQKHKEQVEDIKEDELQMESEELRKIMREELAKFIESKNESDENEEAVEKQSGEEEAEAKTFTEADVLEILEKKLKPYTEETASLKEQLKEIKNTTGLSKSIDDEGSTMVEKKEPGVFDNLFFGGSK